VGTPVEGTILTVARETAEAVERAARNTHDMRFLLETAKDESYASVQRTPNQLKILRDAGVIDSGGYGLYIILEGMWRFVNGQPVEGASRATAKGTHGADASLTQAGADAGGWGYDVQYLIYARGDTTLNVAKVRADIEAMGDCPLVMGDEVMIKVHVHVPDPGVAISYGAALGSLRDVVVEDMQAQSEAFGTSPSEAKTKLVSRSASGAALSEVASAVIAVASGRGLANAFRDVGARIVIEGGQTMNPSVEDFLAAIRQAHARSVILLPNNSNIIMTAQQAAGMSDVPARVVPVKTIPQGIAATIAFNTALAPEDNAKAMTDAAGRVITAEITTSTRSVTLSGVTVRTGQVIGLIDDKLATAGDSVADTLLATLDQARAAGHELITLYYGNGQNADEASAVAERVRAAYPTQQVDLIPGDQPHYFFIAGVE